MYSKYQTPKAHFHQTDEYGLKTCGFCYSSSQKLRMNKEPHHKAQHKNCKAKTAHKGCIERNAHKDCNEKTPQQCSAWTFMAANEDNEMRVKEHISQYSLYGEQMGHALQKNTSKMKKMKKEMKQLKERLAVCEKQIKHSNQNNLSLQKTLLSVLTSTSNNTIHGENTQSTRLLLCHTLLNDTSRSNTNLCDQRSNQTSIYNSKHLIHARIPSAFREINQDNHLPVFQKGKNNIPLQGQDPTQSQKPFRSTPPLFNNIHRHQQQIYKDPFSFVSSKQTKQSAKKQQKDILQHSLKKTIIKENIKPTKLIQDKQNQQIDKLMSDKILKSSKQMTMRNIHQQATKDIYKKIPKNNNERQLKNSNDKSLVKNKRKQESIISKIEDSMLLSDTELSKINNSQYPLIYSANSNAVEKPILERYKSGKEVSPISFKKIVSMEGNDFVQYDQFQNKSKARPSLESELRNRLQILPSEIILELSTMNNINEDSGVNIV